MHTRVSWNIHTRLAKKELCHSNATWHALNSSFPDTNCIVSFRINPHWISNSGLWKVLLETFQNGLENWQRESCFTRTMLLHAHKSVIAKAAVCDCGFELVDHPPYSPDLELSDYFLFPNMKKHLAGSSIRPMMRSYLQLTTFSRIRMRASTCIPWESKHCNTDGRSVWTAGETMLKNKPHLVKYDHCIIVSLWTFQPILEYFGIFHNILIGKLFSSGTVHMFI